MNQSPEQVIEQLRAENNALKIRCFDIGMANEQLQQALNKITGASGLTGNHSVDDITRHVYLLAHPEEREQLEKDIVQAKAAKAQQAQDKSNPRPSKKV